eukprot:gb/GECG01004937.1/.p1 GENE.gb/GECG01004937.1/~~gb/GECG01004937.1/.p1  ORF type:complete len:253 (+),score=20.70 gb/GECG01004937.1/:1-759(+)
MYRETFLKQVSQAGFATTTRTREGAQMRAGPQITKGAIENFLKEIHQQQQQHISVTSGPMDRGSNSPRMENGRSCRITVASNSPSSNPQPVPQEVRIPGDLLSVEGENKFSCAPKDVERAIEALGVLLCGQLVCYSNLQENKTGKYIYRCLFGKTSFNAAATRIRHREIIPKAAEVVKRRRMDPCSTPAYATPEDFGGIACTNGGGHLKTGEGFASRSQINCPLRVTVTLPFTMNGRVTLEVFNQHNHPKCK